MADSFKSGEEASDLLVHHCFGNIFFKSARTARTKCGGAQSRASVAEHNHVQMWRSTITCKSKRHRSLQTRIFHCLRKDILSYRATKSAFRVWWRKVWSQNLLQCLITLLEVTIANGFTFISGNIQGLLYYLDQ